ncbi:SufD family Fe-S cluster assembly protein [Collinsella sp. AGMB00827]|uniref:SufD family Fe-S cluster assembly protein n=2 Tax=Collinsella ureilytica TaxID=2869515 RepID=A0ABS7MI21_9ACTN|nr:SufD family Fe-S cluster assembly protein [Collinsella urealyticum]
MGSEAYAYLRGLAGKPVVLDVPGGLSAAVRVELDGRIGAARATAIDVIARRGSTLDLVIALDGVDEGAFSRTQLGAESGQTSSTSPQNSAPQAPSTAKPAKTPAPGAAHIDARSCAGLIGSSLRIFAGSAARVRVTYVQTADDAFIALDDTGILLDEGAHVDISHTILGAGTSCTGLAADLRGDTSRLEVRTSYLGVREQIRDFNYAPRHLGRRTRSDMDANGVLTGASTKVLRGTIDLMHGCSGSEGAEHETVLIADERVENKTVPVILCDEDDVAGNHGATIGHVRPNQLFYLSSRGISETQAEALFTSAKLEDAAHAAPTKKIRAAVARLADHMGVDLEEEIA